MVTGTEVSSVAGPTTEAPSAAGADTADQVSASLDKHPSQRVAQLCIAENTDR